MLPVPCLMLVTDRSLCVDAGGLVAAVEAAVAGGVDAVQLREKDLAGAELSTLARRLREATRGRALLLVNGPLEAALDAGADGVHLPEAAPAATRPREGLLVGRSVHSLEAARRAEAGGVDYLIAGPVYETRSHPGREPAGLPLIEEVAGNVRVPVLAIGGVSAERVEEVVRAGASGVAVISAILAQEDPSAGSGQAVRAAAEALRRALEVAWQRSSVLKETS